MSRKAADFWWNEVSGRNISIPQDVAYYEKKMIGDWETVTWSDIHKERTHKISMNIQQKRASEQIKPCLIWVFSHGYWLMGGYYTVIKTLHNEYYLNFRGVNISTSEKELQMQVMKAFPYCLPLPEFFYAWMIEFVKKNRNKNFYKGWSNQGLAKAYCKLDKYGDLSGIGLRVESLKLNTDHISVIRPHIPNKLVGTENQENIMPCR